MRRRALETVPHGSAPSVGQMRREILDDIMAFIVVALTVRQVAEALRSSKCEAAKGLLGEAVEHCYRLPLDNLAAL